MKGVIASELVIVCAMMICLYLLWIHDEQLKRLEVDYYELRSDVTDLKPKPRAPRAPKPKEA